MIDSRPRSSAAAWNRYPVKRAIVPSSHVFSPDEPHERHRVGQRDRREVQRPLLLERGSQREEERRDKRESCSHA